jgi:ArsR family transcriptional regulator, arsenate/arsenite/antimonite-responsive transcriptional repressor
VKSFEDFPVFAAVFARVEDLPRRADICDRLTMDRNALPVVDSPDSVTHPAALDKPLDPVRAGELATVFKALADPVRLRLLSLISAHREMCVCDLADGFDLTQPTISHHLKVLRRAGLITSQRRATWVYYRTVPRALAGVAELMAATPGATAHSPSN